MVISEMIMTLLQKNNEDNDSENIAEHDEYNNDLKIGKTIIIITIMEIVMLKIPQIEGIMIPT